VTASSSPPMTTASATPQRVAAMVDATGDLALALDIGAVEVLGAHDVPRLGMAGAYIPLLGEDQSFQLALLSTPAGCADLTRLLLGMAPDDEVSDADVADAVGELVNILAGGVKQRMQPTGGRLQLGLPVFITGDVQPTPHLEVSVVFTRIGGIDVKLMVLRATLSSRA